MVLIGSFQSSSLWFQHIFWWILDKTKSTSTIHPGFQNPGCHLHFPKKTRFNPPENSSLSAHIHRNIPLGGAISAAVSCFDLDAMLSRSYMRFVLWWTELKEPTRSGCLYNIIESKPFRRKKISEDMVWWGWWESFPTKGISDFSDFSDVGWSRMEHMVFDGDCLMMGKSRVSTRGINDLRYEEHK